MRIVILGVALAALALPAMAQVQVQGHIRKDGVYVPPHTRTAPNDTNVDNYSTKPNVNPYTGKAGTVAPDYTYKPPKPPKTPSSSFKPYKAPKY